MHENEIIISLILGKIKQNLSRIEEINERLKKIAKNESKIKPKGEVSQKAKV
ncbi:MAG: hypothetical protein ACTSVV_09925 [Promethearchaeota archaeon]